MNTNLVDFHCHLDLYPDYEKVFSESEKLGIYTLAVTTTPKAWPRNFELASKTKYVRAALGLHPQLISERGEELSLWENYLPNARYVGEIGLDAGPRFYRSIELQKKVFERILKLCAKSGDKILSVHSTRAVAVVLDMIEEYLPLAKGRVVLHWFTGSRTELLRAISLGCFFSINNKMFESKRGPGLIKEIPLNRLLTETDGPFINRGENPLRPKDTASTVEILAHTNNIDIEVMAEQILSNLNTLSRS